MPTPDESDLETAAAKVTNELAATRAKVKSLWVRWEPYAIAVASLILGGFLAHLLQTCPCG